MTISLQNEVSNKITDLLLLKDTLQNINSKLERFIRNTLIQKGITANRYNIDLFYTCYIYYNKYSEKVDKENVVTNLMCKLNIYHQHIYHYFLSAFEEIKHGKYDAT